MSIKQIQALTAASRLTTHFTVEDLTNELSNTVEPTNDLAVFQHVRKLREAGKIENIDRNTYMITDLGHEVLGGRHLEADEIALNKVRHAVKNLENAKDRKIVLLRLLNTQEDIISEKENDLDTALAELHHSLGIFNP